MPPWQGKPNQNERPHRKECCAFPIWTTQSAPCSAASGHAIPPEPKRTVLSSLGSRDSTRAYAHAIDDFIAWYCSEPRLAFGKHVVLRYRIELESRLLAPTINVRLAAVRRLAYEAADSGLLSPELAAGIQRVKGAKKLGVRLVNWLTVDECRRLLRAPDEKTLKGKRDRAVLAILLGCGLRRAEVAKLQVRDLQQREEHWAVVDLIGKGRHIRTEIGRAHV